MPSRDMEGHEKSHFFPSKIVGILWFVYLTDFKLFISEVQGVPQYFGHLEICNFSASGVPRIAILDIFGKPGQFWFWNYPYF